MLELFEIRIIEQTDLPKMMKIWNLFNDILTHDKRTHTIGTLTTWYVSRTKLNLEYYGAYVNNNLVGFMILQSGRDQFKIKMIAVKPEYQNQSLGKRLVYFALKEAHGLPVLTEVKVENYSVINALINGGFKIIDFDDHLYEYKLKFELGDPELLKDW